MRNVKFLIKEARQNTNTVDNESIPSDLCIALLNRSLNYLISTLYNMNVRIRLFSKELQLVENGTRTYDLPWDVYTLNGIINLRFDSNGYSTFIDQVSDKNRTDRFGYVVTNGKIHINPKPSTYGDFWLKYSAKTPLFALQGPQITAISANTSITAADLPDDFSDTTEYYCIVDKFGEIVQSRIYVSQAGTVLLCPDTTGVTTDMFIVPGYYATTHCPLPDELEPVLIQMLEVLINARLSSTDLPISDAISKAQIESLAETFADNSADPITPPILEFREWV
jgi:hypothetical protein